MPDFVFAAAGCIVVAIVALDVFRSLLVPRASNRVLRVAPLLIPALFSAWQAVADLIPEKGLRQAFRASFAPLTLVLTFVVWSGLLILGFGLLLWARRSAFTPALTDLGDAVYAAGSAFSTLGISGTVSGDLARFVVLVCSISGLVVVTVVATFLISIQSSYARRETLVLRLESHVTLPPAGIVILETYAREAIVGRLGVFFDAWEAWAAEVAIGHRAFPILLFFRSNDSRCEWLAAFGAILDAAALVDAVLTDVPAEARASAHFVLRTGARVLDDMARQFDVADDADADPPDEDRFDTDRSRLAAAGYRIAADRDASRDRFEARRAAYAGALAALARRLHIAIDGKTSTDADSRAVGR